MSLTDGPLMLRPILALQALAEAGVTITGKVDEDPYGGTKVILEALWRAAVREPVAGSRIATIPLVVVAEAPTLEEAAEKVLARIKGVAASAEAEAARVAGTPARAF